MSKDFGITKSGLSDWHYLWIVPLYIVLFAIMVMVGVTIFSAFVALSVVVISIGSAIIALPVWLIWGSVFPATMTYFEWFGAITCIRLIFAPMFHKSLTNTMNEKLKNIQKEFNFKYEKNINN